MNASGGTLLDISQRIKAESPAGYMTPMRKCAQCNTRRSIGQFPNQATVCLQCKRRGG